MPKYVVKSFRAVFICKSAFFLKFSSKQIYKLLYISQKFDSLAITHFVISTFFTDDFRAPFVTIMSQANSGNKRFNFFICNTKT